MTVKPELKGYKDKDGRQAVFIRISSHGKRSFKKTQIKLLSTEWERGKVKNSHPNAQLYNSIIRKAVVEIEASSFTVSKYQDGDLFKYCMACFNEWDRVKASETIRQYWSEINNLKAFTAGVKLSAITPEWLNRYKAFCFAQKNSVNTVHKKLKFLRLIVRKAHKERLIEQNPFDIFEMPKYRNPEKQYLTREQIDKLETASRDLELNDTARAVATWFVIGCFTGLRFGDMVHFNKKKHVINGRLILYTRKTGTPVSMPLSDKLKALLEQVKYKGVSVTNIHFNRVLKEVAGICGIDSINAHMSRHSFAIMCANKGISQEVTAKLMGHTSLKSTAIYYKITSVRIDDEIKKLG